MANVSSYLITGATGGIGSELARRLAKSDAQLMLAGRDAAKLKALSDELSADSFQMDGTNSEEVNGCVSHTVEKFGRLDGVAHCIGSLVLKPGQITTDEEWSAAIETNLTSAFYVLRATVKAMRKSGGSLVLVSSAAARVGLANHEAIAAAKAGIIGLTLSAAASCADKGIRINCVAPGLVQTPLTEQLVSTESKRERSEAMHPMKQIGSPTDVASAIAWFLAPEQRWITGQVLGVDGGLGSLIPKLTM